MMMCTWSLHLIINIVKINSWLNNDERLNVYLKSKRPKFYHGENMQKISRSRKSLLLESVNQIRFIFINRMVSTWWEKLWSCYNRDHDVTVQRDRWSKFDHLTLSFHLMYTRYIMIMIICSSARIDDLNFIICTLSFSHDVYLLSWFLWSLLRSWQYYCATW